MRLAVDKHKVISQRRGILRIVNRGVEKMSNRGGKREGAGRPLSAGEPRTGRNIRATDSEWQIIKNFAEIVKYGDKSAAIAFIEEHKVRWKD